MDQMSKMQVVAKKMEKMLETSLQQLKAEQNLRKEAEEKSKHLETKLMDFSVQADEAEASNRREMAEKDEKILNLEASIEFLQEALMQKEEEVTRKEEIITKLRKRIDVFNTETRVGTSLETVNKFEKRLSQLIKGEDKEDTVKSEKEDRTPIIPFITTSENFVSVDEHLERRSKTIVEDVQLPKKRQCSPSKSNRRIQYENSAIEITPLNSTLIGRPPLEESFEEGFHGFESEDASGFLISCDNISTVNHKSAIEAVDGPDEIIIHDQNIVIQDADESWDESDYIMETEMEHNSNMKEEEPEQKHDPEEKCVVNSRIKHKTHCRVCRKEFPNRESLSQHEQRTGHDMRFPCSHCGKRFKQKVQARRHEAQIHSTEMPFECNRCDRKFKSEFSWKRHQDNDEIHEKLANWTPFLTCEICGKQFERRRKWCLDQHMLTHETEKRFQCEICHKFFRTTNYLTQHVKACSGLKQEECAFCGKRFAKKSVLLNHERLHTGERPYQCRVCGQSFRTHSNYSKHGREEHGAESAIHFNELQNEAEAEAQ